MLFDSTYKRYLTNNICYLTNINCYTQFFYMQKYIAGILFFTVEEKNYIQYWSQSFDNDEEANLFIHEQEHFTYKSSKDYYVSKKCVQRAVSPVSGARHKYPVSMYNLVISKYDSATQSLESLLLVFVSLYTLLLAEM